MTNKSKDLKKHPNPEEIFKYKNPITFWADKVIEGEIISSFPKKELKQLKEVEEKTQDNSLHYHVQFGRHTDFSTPIKEYLKAPVKE